MEGATSRASAESELHESGAVGQKKRLFNPIKSLKRFFGLHSKKGSEDHVSGVGIRAKSASDMQQACSTDDTRDDVQSTSNLASKPISRSTDCIYSKEVSFIHTGLALPGTTLQHNRQRVSSHTLPVTDDDQKNSSAKVVQSSSRVVDAPSALIAVKKTDELPKNDKLPADEQKDSEVFFDSVWTLTASTANIAAVSESCMTLNDEDLSAVCTSVERGLDGQAALHKRAVRPRNRRTLSMYQPYLPTVSDSSSKDENVTEKTKIQPDQDLKAVVTEKMVLHHDQDLVADVAEKMVLHHDQDLVADVAEKMVLNPDQDLVADVAEKMVLNPDQDLGVVVAEKTVQHPDKNTMMESADGTKQQTPCSIELSTKLTSSDTTQCQPSLTGVKLRQHTSSCSTSSRATARRRYTTEIPRSVLAGITGTSFTKQPSVMVAISPPPLPESSTPIDKTGISEFEQIFSKFQRRKSHNTSQDSHEMETSGGNVVLSGVARQTSDMKLITTEKLPKDSTMTRNNLVPHDRASVSKDFDKYSSKSVSQKSASVTSNTSSQSKLLPTDAVHTHKTTKSFSAKYLNCTTSETPAEETPQLQTKHSDSEVLINVAGKPPSCVTRQSSIVVSKPISVQNSKSFVSHDRPSISTSQTLDKSSAQAALPKIGVSNNSNTVSQSKQLSAEAVPTTKPTGSRLPFTDRPAIIGGTAGESMQSTSRFVQPVEKSTAVSPTDVASITTADKRYSHSRSSDDKRSSRDVQQANQNRPSNDKHTSHDVKQANQCRLNDKQPPRDAPNEVRDVKEVRVVKLHSIALKRAKEFSLPTVSSESHVVPESRQQSSGGRPIHSRSSSMYVSSCSTSQQRTVSNEQNLSIPKGIKKTGPVVEPATTSTSANSAVIVSHKTLQSSAPHRSLIVRSASVANTTARPSAMEEQQACVDEPPWFAMARQKTSSWTEGKV